ncbi:hypothetical protein [Vibrio gazogenes]|nr:hypothetical protein [Vibrio gazogenes]USP15767.1 hypothetical protein MKS89_20495 [Vibrio gazogenes]
MANSKGSGSRVPGFAMDGVFSRVFYLMAAQYHGVQSVEPRHDGLNGQTY